MAEDKFQANDSELEDIEGEQVLGAEEPHEDVDIEGLREARHAVRLVDVCRYYKIGNREINAVSNVNLEANPGDYIAVYGPSGSGKTTLLNLIGSIDRATSGRVLVMDVPIEDYDETFRATFRLANTGYIFQSYNLISTLTAIENVMFPMQLSDKGIDDIRNEALQLLEMVQLAEWRNHLPWQLSSGEQQRVAIARAMANDPPIILADEPTANLDAESAHMVRDLLGKLNQDGKTVIVMTHDEKIINRKGAKRFRMINGELLADE